jgi:polysaccharide export outer membrane protein
MQPVKVFETYSRIGIIGELKKIGVLWLIFLFFQISLFISPLLCGAQSKAYRIGPNDVLNLAIYAGGEKQFDESLTVSNMGTIAAPFIGDTKVQGFTPTELESKIKASLARDFFVDPRVNINIVGYHSLHYYISGAVQTPGLYEVSAQITLIELIAKAGGALSDRGNLAYIMRNASPKDVKKLEEGQVDNLLSQTKPIKVDLQRLLDMGEMGANVLLKSGDMVYIPLMKSLDVGLSQIYVEGEVQTPGIYDFRPGMTAMNACVMAGGFDTFAAPNRTRIIRKIGDKVTVIKIDLNEVRDGDIPDIELQPGDRIHVPETWL